jgi:hypothetical protein
MKRVDPEREGKRKACHERIAKLKTEKEMLRDDFLKGRIDEKTYYNERARLDEKIKEENASLHEMFERSMRDKKGGEG